MDAENIHQVFDWLWTSGQLSESDIASLSSLGIEAVINLALPTSPNALPGEAELVTQQGISYTQITGQSFCVHLLTSCRHNFTSA